MTRGTIDCQAVGAPRHHLPAACPNDARSRLRSCSSWAPARAASPRSSNRCASCTARDSPRTTDERLCRSCTPTCWRPSARSCTTPLSGACTSRRGCVNCGRRRRGGRGVAARTRPSSFLLRLTRPCVPACLPASLRSAGGRGAGALAPRRPRVRHVRRPPGGRHRGAVGGPGHPAGVRQPGAVPAHRLGGVVSHGGGGRGRGAAFPLLP